MDSCEEEDADFAYLLGDFGFEWWGIARFRVPHWLRVRARREDITYENLVALVNDLRAGDKLPSRQVLEDYDWAVVCKKESEALRSTGASRQESSTYQGPDAGFADVEFNIWSGVPRKLPPDDARRVRPVQEEIKALSRIFNEEIKRVDDLNQVCVFNWIVYVPEGEMWGFREFQDCDYGTAMRRIRTSIYNFATQERMVVQKQVVRSALRSNPRLFRQLDPDCMGRFILEDPAPHTPTG